MTDTIKIIITAASTGFAMMFLDIIKNTYRTRKYKNGNGDGNDRRKNCVIHEFQLEAVSETLIEIKNDIKDIKDIKLLSIVTTQAKNEQNIKLNYRQLQGILKRLNMPYPSNGD